MLHSREGKDASVISSDQVHSEAEAYFLRLARQYTFPDSWSQYHRHIGSTGRLRILTKKHKMRLKLRASRINATQTRREISTV